MDANLFVMESGGVVKSTDLKCMAGKMSEVRFDRARAGRGDVLGDPNGGWDLMGRIMDTAAVASCCTAAGMAGQVLDMTVAYAKDRKQFDRPIGSFQAIQHYCADMFIDVESIRLSAYHAAWRITQGLSFAEQAAQARGVAIDAGERVISLAHQIHAAIGVTMEYDLHYYTRGMKAALLSFGDASSLHEVVARSMGL
ncbi:MAG: acyl-CoA dehydrogenase [Chloroflexi bacterium]|nr:acyl-CoA dehydrogenase [Chloroflexota bacterium]